GLLSPSGALRLVRLYLRPASLLEHLRKDRTLRIRPDNPDVWILSLEKPGDACDCAACADTDHNMRQFALGLIPDFRPRGLVVRFGIRGIFVLVREKAVRNFAAVT